MDYKTSGKCKRLHRHKTELPTERETIKVITFQITIYIYLTLYIYQAGLYLLNEAIIFCQWILLSTIKMGYTNSSHCTWESSVFSMTQRQ